MLHPWHLSNRPAMAKKVAAMAVVAGVAVMAGAAVDAVTGARAVTKAAMRAAMNRVPRSRVALAVAVVGVKTVATRVVADVVNAPSAQPIVSALIPKQQHLSRTADPRLKTRTLLAPAQNSELSVRRATMSALNATAVVNGRRVLRATPGRTISRLKTAPMQIDQLVAMLRPNSNPLRAG